MHKPPFYKKIFPAGNQAMQINVAVKHIVAIQ